MGRSVGRVFNLYSLRGAGPLLVGWLNCTNTQQHHSLYVPNECTAASTGHSGGKEKGPAEKDQGICEGGSGVSNEPSNLVAPEGSIRFERRERGGMFMRSGQLANI